MGVTKFRILKASGYLIVALVVGLQMTFPIPAQAATRFETGFSTSGTLLRMKDKELSDRMSNIRTSGATWVRIDFNWPTIQPDGPSKYKWEMYDRIVRVAGVHHLKVLAVLDYTPKWAREPRCATIVKEEEAAKKCNPRSYEEFANFAKAAARRYRHQSIRAWEIWNEPNVTGHWKTARPDHSVFVDPDAYAGLANAVAAQIRRYSPDTVIITGGLSPMFEPKYPNGMRQSDYLAKLLPKLKSHLFDAVGMHPYSWPAMPNKAAPYNAFYTVDKGKSSFNLRTVLDSAGWGDKEIWGTEYGASTKGLRSMATPIAKGRPDHVTEAMQAQIIKQGIQAWYSKPNVGPLFVHSDGDQWLTSRKNEGGFGLRRSDGSEKPAYDAFVRATREIRARQD